MAMSAAKTAAATYRDLADGAGLASAFCMAGAMLERMSTDEDLSGRNEVWGGAARGF